MADDPIISDGGGRPMKDDLFAPAAVTPVANPPSGPAPGEPPPPRLGLMLLFTAAIGAILLVGAAGVVAMLGHGTVARSPAASAPVALAPPVADAPPAAPRDAFASAELMAELTRIDAAFSVQANRCLQADRRLGADTGRDRVVLVADANASSDACGADVDLNAPDALPVIRRAKLTEDIQLCHAAFAALSAGAKEVAMLAGSDGSGASAIQASRPILEQGRGDAKSCLDAYEVDIRAAGLTTPAAIDQGTPGR
ncbi:MAG TPA: hypothetical protein VGI95_18095 [Caulobacteraceae bacterium]|jgi:hypothetical protein